MPLHKMTCSYSFFYFSLNNFDLLFIYILLVDTCSGKRFTLTPNLSLNFFLNLHFNSNNNKVCVQFYIHCMFMYICVYVSVCRWSSWQILRHGLMLLLRSSSLLVWVSVLSSLFPVIMITIMTLSVRQLSLPSLTVEHQFSPASSPSPSMASKPHSTLRAA